MIGNRIFDDKLPHRFYYGHIPFELSFIPSTSRVSPNLQGNIYISQNTNCLSEKIFPFIEKLIFLPIIPSFLLFSCDWFFFDFFILKPKEVYCYSEKCLCPLYFLLIFST